MTEQKPAVFVIGGGVVGMATALYLRRSGNEVTVLDPFPSPGGASFGNAGMLSTDTSVPIALPGMLPNVPNWLLDPLGPLAVRPSYFPTAFPWLMKWIAAGRIDRVHEISDAMRAMHRESFKCWQELLGPANFSSLIRQTGQVHVWETPEETKGAALERTLRERQGIESQVLGVDDLRQMFPGITRKAQRGVLVPGNGYTVNPQRLIATLAELFQADGGRVLSQEVRKIVRNPSGGFRLITNTGYHHASKVVVAAGAHSLRLLKPLNVKVPLETERGYHVMLPQHGLHLTTTLSNKSRSFGITQMEHGLRVAGTVEFAGLDAPPNEQRAEALLHNIREMFPEVNTSGHTVWMGFRPSTPDSLPIAGEVAKYPGLYLAFGHGHFGMTGGPPTARLVASIVNGTKPPLDPKPYSMERFS